MSLSPARDGSSAASLAPTRSSAPPVAVAVAAPRGLGPVRALTFLMFMMFAVTTDSVGVIIPQVIKDFHLGMASAGSVHYAEMVGIALGGLGLGVLADRLGRKRAILSGLSVFAGAGFLFGVSESFPVFLVLLFVSGVAIGVFKTGALALIGDISRSTREHTATMNLVEAFFGVGAMAGPAGVTFLLSQGASWKWIYVLAGGFCLLLIGLALQLKTAKPDARPERQVDPGRFPRVLANPWTAAFGVVVMLYVGVEAVVCVWMPTLLAGYRGPATLVAAYSLSVFYGIRTMGRFLGPWVLNHAPWTYVLAACSFAILVCFVVALLGGRSAAVYALPGSGLFMSVLYPTLNSKGISCFPKSEHGAIAGVLLFFTCLSGVASPLAAGLISDRLGDANFGFLLATGLAGLLFVALMANLVADPSRKLLRSREQVEYQAGDLPVGV
jgi:fucose permease